MEGGLRRGFLFHEMWTQFDVGCGFSKQRKRPAPRSTSHDSRIAIRRVSAASGERAE